MGMKRKEHDNKGWLCLTTLILFFFFLRYILLVDLMESGHETAEWKATG